MDTCHVPFSLPSALPTSNTPQPPRFQQLHHSRPIRSGVYETGSINTLLVYCGSSSLHTTAPLWVRVIQWDVCVIQWEINHSVDNTHIAIPKSKLCFHLLLGARFHSKYHKHHFSSLSTIQNRPTHLPTTFPLTTTNPKVRKYLHPIKFRPSTWLFVRVSLEKFVYWSFLSLRSRTRTEQSQELVSFCISVWWDHVAVEFVCLLCVRLVCI